VRSQKETQSWTLSPNEEVSEKKKLANSRRFKDRVRSGTNPKVDVRGAISKFKSQISNKFQLPKFKNINIEGPHHFVFKILLQLNGKLWGKP
jgi:hypothetical protein